MVKDLINEGIFDTQLDRLLNIIPDKKFTLSNDDVTNLIGVVFEVGVTAGYEGKELVSTWDISNETAKIIDKNLSFLKKSLHI